ncbi:(deoxy)nucleoside triphosphate pyrophosphohydrolase [Georgenia halophila]|uniref:8-oxo-dGTP diphosphatase n=1 Tax=Georgenia halophila TaxID=620889 RepID=A0ABP8LEL9_9MICO
MTSPRASERRLVAAAAVVDSLDAPTAILCARRSAPEALAGRWELPGGKVEPGESAEEALHRELAEELGARVRLGPVIPADDGGDWPILHHLRMRVWMAELVAGSPKPLQDHDELAWIAPADLQDLDWLDPDRPIARALQAATIPQDRTGTGAYGSPA